MRIRALHFIFASFICTGLFSSHLLAMDCITFLNGSPIEFSLNPKSSDSTRGLIAYLDLLLEKKIIGEFELTSFIESIKAGQFENPIDESKAELDSERYEHYLGLEQYRAVPDLDFGEILDWVRSQLKKDEKEKKERSTVRKETEEITWQMEFLTILPGEFMMGEYKNKKIKKIKEAFEIMSTPVTQKQWSLVMGENPSQFYKGEKEITVMINGKSIRMQPDHPVESVNAIEDVNHPDYQKGVFYFIETLNRLANENDPLIYRIIPDHKRGYIYRLPTSVEWEFVAKNRGKNNEEWSFGANEFELGDYAWYEANSEKQTHEVATKYPLLIDTPHGEKPIYDLHGNVNEWVQDRVQETEGVIFRGLRGGSYADHINETRTAFMSRVNEGGANYIGLRLVRVKAEKTEGEE